MKNWTVYYIGCLAVLSGSLFGLWQVERMERLRYQELHRSLEAAMLPILAERQAAANATAVTGDTRDAAKLAADTLVQPITTRVIKSTSGSRRLRPAPPIVRE